MRKKVLFVSLISFVFLLGSGDQDKKHIGKTKESSIDRQLKRGVISNSRTLLDESLKMGANPNLSVSEGRSLLMEASYKKRFYHVKELIKYGAKVNYKGNGRQTALHQAAKAGSIKIVTHLLNQGAKINAQAKSGTTALKIAVLSENVEMVKLLLSRGADPTMPGMGNKDIRSLGLESVNPEIKALFTKKLK